MGSKRYMLKNGLGELLRAELPHAKRFVDLFCGAGSIVNFVAVDQKFKKPIIAGDLQKYSIALVSSVIKRTKPLKPETIKTQWIDEVKIRIEKEEIFKKSIGLDQKYSSDVEKWVKKSRHLCDSTISKKGPIWRAYGGHYYSPKQALIFDYLLDAIPHIPLVKDVCLAALIVAASRCAAAPGHTAQPFQPTEGASKFIKIAWSMDPFKSCETALKEICPMHSQVKGIAEVSDALKLVSKLKNGDLVLLDPPYSGVQYSRFYHVLETLARGKVGDVSGVGRYPDITERPQSAFSNAGQSKEALQNLMLALAKQKVKVIFTFPKGECSNGLSGDDIIEVAQKYFEISNDSRIHEHVIKGRFSTLGGNNKLKLKNNRVKESRVKSEELVLLLKPRKIK